MEDKNFKRHSKHRKVFFKKINLGTNNKININKQFINIFNNYKNKNYNNVSVLNIKDKQIYLAGIKYYNLNDKVPIYLLNIECIDRNDQIIYGDISKDFAHRRIVPNSINKNNNAGSMCSSQIAIDSLRNIVAITRGNNSIKQKNIIKFLKKLLSTSIMFFDAILNKKVIDDIAKYDIITKFEYSISSPDKFEDIDESNKNLDTQIQEASKLQSNSITTTFKTHLSNKNIIIDKISKFMRQFNNKKSKINKLNIAGINAGEEDVIDLIKNVLSYNGKIHYNKEIDIEDVFDLLIYSFQQKYNFINKHYIIEN